MKIPVRKLEPWQIDATRKVTGSNMYKRGSCSRVTDTSLVCKDLLEFLSCLLSELGLCSDKKKLMKKRIRRGLKEGDDGYLQQASDSDSALEDSSSGSGSGSDDGSGSDSSDESGSDDDDDDVAGNEGSDEPSMTKHLKELLAGEGESCPESLQK